MPSGTAEQQQNTVPPGDRPEEDSIEAAYALQPYPTAPAGAGTTAGAVLARDGLTPGGPQDSTAPGHRPADFLPGPRRAVEPERTDPLVDESGAASRAAMLVARARQLSQQGRAADAAAPARAAVRLLGRLADGSPDVFDGALVEALSLLASVLSRCGGLPDAVKISESALRRARRLAAGDHVRHRPLLAVTLRETGARLGDAGEQDRAFALIRESVQVHRSLASRAPQLHRVGLAEVLDDFAGLLATAGLVPEALSAFTEAERLLASVRPPHDSLPGVLLRHATLLTRLGRHTEAAEAARRAVRLRRESAEREAAYGDPDGRAADALAAALQTYGVMAGGAGRQTQAVEALEEAVRLRGQRLRTDPGQAKRPEVAMTYALYGTVLVAAGRPVDAVPALAAALRAAAAIGHDRATTLASDALERALRADAGLVRERWRQVTGEEFPAWMDRRLRPEEPPAPVPPAPAPAAPKRPSGLPLSSAAAVAAAGMRGPMRRPPQSLPAAQQ